MARFIDGDRYTRFSYDLKNLMTTALGFVRQPRTVFVVREFWGDKYFRGEKVMVRVALRPNRSTISHLPSVII